MSAANASFSHAGRLMGFGRGRAALVCASLLAALGLTVGVAQPAWSVRLGEPITLMESDGDC